MNLGVVQHREQTCTTDNVADEYRKTGTDLFSSIFTVIMGLR